MGFISHVILIIYFRFTFLLFCLLKCPLHLLSFCSYNYGAFEAVNLLLVAALFLPTNFVMLNSHCHLKKYLCF